MLHVMRPASGRAYRFYSFGELNDEFASANGDCLPAEVGPISRNADVDDAASARRLVGNEVGLSQSFLPVRS